MLTLSELYAADLPAAVFLPEYPSSKNTEARFVNHRRYLIHDPTPPPTLETLSVLGPHHLLCAWGDRLPAAPGVRPSGSLQEHWRECLGVVLDLAGSAANRRCITLFPLESLPPERHAVDPTVHYELLSKETIGKMGCPQARPLQPGRYPCLLKISHGYSGLGNYLIGNGREERAVRQSVEASWPGARTVRTEVIRDIRGDYCAQFYLNRRGEIRWLGATDQLFSSERCWVGARIRGHDQPALRKEIPPVIEPVADYLGQRGYLGIVGVDVVRDVAGRLYVVDVNPRINGSTPFLLAFLAMQDRGWRTGVYRSGLIFRGSPNALLERAATAGPGRVVVLSCAGRSTGQTCCCAAAFAHSAEACDRLLGEVFQFRMKNEE